MLVKEVMTPHVVSIAPEESAALAARLLARHGLGALPVCSAEGILRGMVTDRDIVLRLIDKIGPDRLIFGTDFPMWSHEEELERFLALGFTEAENRRILSDNFKEFMGIE